MRPMASFFKGLAFGDRRDMLRDRNYFIRLLTWLKSEVLMYFDSP